MYQTPNNQLPDLLMRQGNFFPIDGASQVNQATQEGVAQAQQGFQEQARQAYLAQQAQEQQQQFYNQELGKGILQELMGQKLLENALAEQQQQPQVQEVPLQSGFLPAPSNGMPDYSMASGDYYDHVYNDTVATEGSVSLAKRRAARKAREYQAQRMEYLTDQLYKAGGLENGVMNPQALRIVAQMAQEDPTIANFYMNSVPGVKEEYALRNQLLLGNDAQQKKLETMDVAHGYDKENMDINHQYAIEKMIKNAQLSMEQQAAIAQINLATQGMGMQQKLDTAYNAFRQAYGDEQGYLMALQAVYGGGGKSSPGAGTAQDNKRMEAIGKRVKDIEERYGTDTEGLMKDPEYIDLKSKYLAYLRGESEVGNNGNALPYNPNDYNEAAKHMQKLYDDFANGGSDKYTFDDIVRACIEDGIPEEWVYSYFGQAVNSGGNTKEEPKKETPKPAPVAKPVPRPVGQQVVSGINPSYDNAANLQVFLDQMPQYTPEDDRVRGRATRATAGIR